MLFTFCVSLLLKRGGSFLGERRIEIKIVIRKDQFFSMILESDGDTVLRVDFAVIYL
jgi:hypothetical protein